MAVYKLVGVCANMYMDVHKVDILIEAKMEACR